MKEKLFLIVLLYTVSAFCSGNSSVNREKRQEEIDSPWIWGRDDAITESAPNNNQILIKSGATQADANVTEKNPCLEPDLKMPDFSQRGLRISEIKCLENIWHMRRRQYSKQKDADCTKWVDKYGGQRKYVLGGYNASEGEFPHMAAIGWKAAVGTYIFKCGGSLISKQFILTAAHCSKASSLDTSIADPVPKVARLGEQTLKELNPNLEKKISRIIVHPQYKSPKKYFDLALMQLQWPLLGFDRSLQPACLWSGMDTSQLGTKFKLSGWGVTEAVGKKTATVLQGAEVDSVDSQLCNQLLQPMCNRLWCGIQDHQVCAGRLAGGVDTCEGDSGGPLQVEIKLPIKSEGRMYYVIGVTSFGFKCGLANTPGVYTRVASFIDWVEGYVWPSASESEKN